MKTNGSIAKAEIKIVKAISDNLLKHLAEA